VTVNFRDSDTCVCVCVSRCVCAGDPGGPGTLVGVGIHCSLACRSLSHGATVTVTTVTDQATEARPAAGALPGARLPGLGLVTQAAGRRPSQ
jgi:hypothetical protein